MSLHHAPAGGARRHLCAAPPLPKVVRVTCLSRVGAEEALVVPLWSRGDPGDLTVGGLLEMVQQRAVRTRRADLQQLCLRCGAELAGLCAALPGAARLWEGDLLQEVLRASDELLATASADEPGGDLAAAVAGKGRSRSRSARRAARPPRPGAASSVADIQSLISRLHQHPNKAAAPEAPAPRAPQAAQARHGSVLDADTRQVRTEPSLDVDAQQVGKEQRAVFVDASGARHEVWVHLPEKILDPHLEGPLPCAVYFHGIGMEVPLLKSGNTNSEGLRVAREKFIIVSPMVPGVKEKDAYMNTERGDEMVSWISELIATLVHGFGPDGTLRVDPDRLAVTGVSLGGALAYAVGARCHRLLSCAVPVAAYHAPELRAHLAERLAAMPVFCVHSVSQTERTCPIEDELPLWDGIEANGGSLVVKKVHCKHGKTYSHAYEHDAEVWSWILKQRRARP